eukprot:72849-Amphidinium_carterae.1
MRYSWKRTKTPPFTTWLNKSYTELVWNVKPCMELHWYLAEGGSNDVPGTSIQCSGARDWLGSRRDKHSHTYLLDDSEEAGAVGTWN